MLYQAALAISDDGKYSIVKNKAGTGDADGHYTINLQTQPTRWDYRRTGKNNEMGPHT